MKLKLLTSSFLILFTLLSCEKYQEGLIQNIKTEYLDNPMTIAVERPHFSWQMVSEEKDLMQTAYSIKVWTNQETLWKSGKISSDKSVAIQYQGDKLTPFTKYFVQIKVWDNKGNAHISDTATFETGPLSVSDWQAEWIGKAKATEVKFDYQLDSAFWIWFPETAEEMPNPKGSRYFKSSMTIESVKDIESTSLILTGDDTCSLKINGKYIGSAKHLKIPHFNILDVIKEGVNTIEIEASNRWGEAGIFTQLYLKYKDGKIVFLSSDKNWLASRDRLKWNPAFVIGAFGKVNNLNWLNKTSMYPEEILPPTYLRKQFTNNNKPVSARLYATALGIYQIYLNGQKAHTNYFAPGWTDYTKRVLYQSYDVTSLINEGENTIAAIIADGWYTGTIGWGHKRNNYNSYPLWLKAELHIEYANGKKIVICSDSSWKCSYGPIVLADYLDGEKYDARKDIKGWNQNGFDDKEWLSVIQKSINIEVNPDMGNAIVVTDTIKPLGVRLSKNNSYIFDMGQNMVGIINIAAKSKAGDSLVLRYAEMLNPDGTLYTTNLRSAKATDTYIFKSDSTETWSPLFTFHGFRFVEVKGLKQAPDKDMITGLFIQSQTPRTGYFECSDSLVNQVYHNAFWGQKSNYLSVPTDCPQRDERLGWMGDALVFTPTACVNMDVAAFFNKWMQDVVDAQAEDGGFSNVSPRLIATDNGAPAWGDAGVFVPWTIYEHYNNKSMLEKYYPAYTKWIEYVHGANPDLLWVNKCGANFGDWLNTDANTERDVLATAFFAQSTFIVSQMAQVLDKKEDAEKYSALCENIRKAFVKAYVSADGKIKSNTQTPYVLALAFNLLPDEEMKKKAAQHLVDDIKSRNGHHSTGFIGIGNLMQVLTDNGYPEVAYQLMTNKTFPSLGYMVVNGATTIWERWDGWTAEKGFQSPGMNSFNHYSLGSPTRWLYSHVAGINAIEPAYKTFMVKPYIRDNFSFANARIETLYGSITSSWMKTDDGNTRLCVTVPANTKANIFVPGKIIKGIDGLKEIGKEKDFTIFEVGSGKYEFIIQK